MVQINDAAYGGFILSKNVYKKGKPIGYSYREESSIPELNGWTIYSCDDNDKYVSNSKNFVIVGATTIHKLAPVMLEIFDAPYGTDLCWMYEGRKHVGFYDLVQNKDTTIYEIIKRGRFADFYEFVGITGEERIEKIPEFMEMYGGRTFLNGMYRIHDNKDVEKWNEIIRKAFPGVKGSIQVFGYDWLGRNFAVCDKTETVLLFEPGTREVFDTGKTFSEFHNTEIPVDHEVCLMSEYFRKWKEAKDCGIAHNQCVGYKVSLFSKGKEEIENMEISDMESYWKSLYNCLF
ncbi:MAG: DUF2185 domain-containing protein [Acetatifactor sp.]|nr:DUF2185 domain-containing protein [Acetatifactor sp.]